ncbi:hypothetical protein HYC85_027685 [Camellia sinensis]|uniref:Retrotransposon gag domain-containing protein n=1 Tax=Camellia sinensis TaxID=4442 RepID=A0A7J7FX47_CAMSI|nr:hypothetical protein HYC85_027685 [Camellia sinensis]
MENTTEGTSSRQEEMLKDGYEMHSQNKLYMNAMIPAFFKTKSNHTTTVSHHGKTCWAPTRSWLRSHTFSPRCGPDGHIQKGSRENLSFPLKNMTSRKVKKMKKMKNMHAQIMACYYKNLRFHAMSSKTWTLLCMVCRLERLVDGLTRELRQMSQQNASATSTQAEQTNGRHAVPPPPTPVPPQPALYGDGTIALIREFKKMKPPRFSGGIEPMKAEAWVLEMEKLFEIFPSTDAQKVTLAAFTLDDDARRWWMMIREANPSLTWASFLELFYNKYFSLSIRDHKTIAIPVVPLLFCCVSDLVP